LSRPGKDEKGTAKQKEAKIQHEVREGLEKRTEYRKLAEYA